MDSSQEYAHIISRFRYIFASVLFLFAFNFIFATPTQAATGINEQLNYQARLLDTTGGIVPDGTYNVEFKIYQDGDGCEVSGTSPCNGTLKWTETRTGGNKVTVKNGYFSVQLGAVTSFGTSVDWNQDTLWLSLNIGGTGTPSWDGEMTPFRRLTAAAYALNAKQLGGLDYTKYVQVAPASVQADTSLLSTLFLNKTGASGNILQLQKGGVDALTLSNTGALTLKNTANSLTALQVLPSGSSTPVLDVDTTNSRVGIGTAAPGYTLDVVGDINVSTGSVYRINGTSICSASGCAASSTSAIQNQNASDQTADFRISGTGRANTSIITPLVDTATATTLSIGTGTANAISIASSGVATTVNGSLIVQGTGTNTLSGQIAFSGVATDVTTGTNEDLTLLANGTGQIVLNDTTQVATLGTADTATYLCRNASNQIATCNTTGTGAAFIQGGNTFGAAADLGTNDNNAINFRTNNTTKLTVSAAGDLQFANGAGRTFNIAAAASGSHGDILTIQAGSGTGTDRNGGNLVLQAGDRTGTGTAGVIIIKPQTNSTTAFQVQNATGGRVLTADTTNATVGIGTGAISTAKLYIDTGLVGARINETGSNNLFELQSAGVNVAITGPGTYTDTSGTKTFHSLIPNFAPTATSTATFVGLGITPIVNFSNGTPGAGNTTALLVNPTYTAAPTGTNLLADFQNGGTSVLNVGTKGITVGGSTLLNTLAVSNLSSGGNIGTAAATVDLYTSFNVNQTTAAQTVTLPNPTVTTAGRLAYVNNIGTASFTLYGMQVIPGASRSLIWTGSLWALTGDSHEETSFAKRKTADETVTSSATLQDDNDLSFAIGANETWFYSGTVVTGGANGGGVRATLSAPASSTCSMRMTTDYNVASASTATCGTAATLANTSFNDPDSIKFSGTVIAAGTAGTVTLRWAQNVSSGTGLVFRKDGFLNAYRISGADLAEVYYTHDESISMGDIVAIDGTGASQVRKTNTAYDTRAIGVISTKPGMVIGEADGNGQPVIVGLAGRVPVKVNSENGPIKPGDYLVASSTPGVAMKATRPGMAIGQALTEHAGNGQGTILVFIKNTFYPGETSVAGVGATPFAQMGANPANVPTNLDGPLIIGKPDSAQTNLVLDSSSTLADAGACTTTANAGAVYYNSNAGSNSIRSCVNGGWEDVVTTDGLGILLFGVVPDSGAEPGDLASTTTPGVSGPCKVSRGSAANSFSVSACVAYSGGRKVVVAEQKNVIITGLTATNTWAHICLTGPNSQPVLTAAGPTENANLPAWSANNPILCLADIKGSAAGEISQIYDVRTFTNTTKSFTTVASAPFGLGQIARASGAGSAPSTVPDGGFLRGIVVATSGATSTTAPAAIIATSGPAYVKATAGLAGDNYVMASSVPGYAYTKATHTATDYYAILGLSQTNFTAACNTSANCLGSLFMHLQPQ